MVKMEADFSGYVTKAGLKCSDGRTIMPDAFKHQHQKQVPLVWQHCHNDVENILGHVLLENRDDGVYGYGFFNKTPKAVHAKEMVNHKDINMMSIWANQLVERASSVLHGLIREVSLVLAGANPGAVIENITISHSDGDVDVVEDEAIISMGLELEHSDKFEVGNETPKEERTEPEKKEEKTEPVVHADGGPTPQDVYNSMTDEQKQVVHYFVGEAIVGNTAEHSDLDLDEEFQEVYDSLDDNQRELVHSLLNDALSSRSTETNEEKGTQVKHNVFDQTQETKTPRHVISHDDMKSIYADAAKLGSLKEAVHAYAESHLEHGIEDIDILFPEAKAIQDIPELFARRNEWVANLLAGVRKSPFSRIKTLSADITPAEARAKGYIKGTLKKEEFFRVARRITTPKTIYKKQKLDRDDILDITDFDVVVWLKGEMRLMLDEELARAILVGDGRDPADPDKINEDNIRPVATDHELFTTQVNVEFDTTTDAAANAAAKSFMDRVALNRRHLRGTGLPTFYTSETYIARLLLQRDDVGRKLYKNIDELASDLRVKEIVSVEVLEEYPTILGVMVNPTDYVVGADKGGNVSLFDDFDIDYNEYKYLIETRVSGALVKLKAALVFNVVPTADSEITPAAPTFDPATNNITIPTQTGVVYRNADTDAVMTTAGSPYAVPDGETVVVNAEPAAGYYFPTSENDSWPFTNPA